MRKEVHLPKHHNFWQKTLISVVEKEERVNKFLERRKNTVDSGFEPATFGFRTTVTPNTFIIQNTNDSEELWSLRIMGSFRTKEKNADYWIEKFPSKKLFSTENDKNCISINRKGVYFYENLFVVDNVRCSKKVEFRISVPLFSRQTDVDTRIHPGWTHLCCFFF